jgi:hypothetical protein
MATTNTEEESSIRTTVTIPKSDYSEIEKIAREKRVSVAWVVREAVAVYLSDDDKEEVSPAKRAGRK